MLACSEFYIFGRLDAAGTEDRWRKDPAVLVLLSGKKVICPLGDGNHDTSVKPVIGNQPHKRRNEITVDEITELFELFKKTTTHWSLHWCGYAKHTG
jgi:hypothetical protein